MSKRSPTRFKLEKHIIMYFLKQKLHKIDMYVILELVFHHWSYHFENLKYTNFQKMSKDVAILMFNACLLLKKNIFTIENITDIIFIFVCYFYIINNKICSSWQKVIFNFSISVYQQINLLNSSLSSRRESDNVNFIANIKWDFFLFHSLKSMGLVTLHDNKIAPGNSTR